MEFLKGLKKATSSFVDYDDNPTNFQMPVEKKNVIDKDDIKSSESVDLEQSKKSQEKFNNHFVDLMNKMDLPGPDFKEFLQTVDELKEDISGETARFKTANKVLKIPKEKLIQSANYYIEAIDKDGENFSKSVDEKLAEEVISREENMVQLNQIISQDEKLIEEKKKIIEANKARIDILMKEKEVAEEKIMTNKKLYSQANQIFVDLIKNTVSKIQSLL